MSLGVSESGVWGLGSSVRRLRSAVEGVQFFFQAITVLVYSRQNRRLFQFVVWAMPGPAQADDTDQHPAPQHRQKRSKPSGQVKTRGRGRGQHFLTVAGDKRRYDLFFPYTLADLLGDRLLGR